MIVELGRFDREEAWVKKSHLAAETHQDSPRLFREESTVGALAQGSVFWEDRCAVPAAERRGSGGAVGFRSRCSWEVLGEEDRLLVGGHLRQFFGGQTGINLDEGPVGIFQP